MRIFSRITPFNQLYASENFFTTFSFSYHIPPFLSFDYQWASPVISIIFLFEPPYLFIVIVQWFVHFSCYVPAEPSEQAPGVPAEQLSHHKTGLQLSGQKPLHHIWHIWEQRARGWCVSSHVSQCSHVRVVQSSGHILSLSHVSSCRPRCHQLIWSLICII